MAITRTDFRTTDDLRTFLTDLNLFDDVTGDGNSVNCYFDGSSRINVLTIPWSDTTTNSLTFRPAPGKQVYVNCWGPRTAFKTKNGALLLNSISGGNSGYILHMIIGKTNNGEVAVAIGLGATVSSLTTCAYNEIGQDIGTTYQFRGSTIYWNDTSQIITAPIPTHPSTGTSCINGASTIIIGPQISPGIVNIGGIDYATDGILCLDDEDHT